MLKLKYLFNNKDLANMILENWEYDREDPNLFEYYRISTNAVYWFQNNGNTFFLRFTPSSEKSKETILAELEHLNYLKNNNYAVVETILSKLGNELEEVNTPWGTYYACAFKKAPGTQISRIQLTDDLIFRWGKSLGRLHSLNNKYQPKDQKRCDWSNVLDWVNSVISKYPEETAAKSEVGILKDFFSKLPISNQNYGLVHFDFESDNIFFDENTNIITPIDFDDSLYHWYAMDICQAVESLKEEIPEKQLEFALEKFISGYHTEFSITEDELKLLPIFKRFSNLFGYARILYSIDERWNNEPDWLLDLRKKLNRLLVERSSYFGVPLS